MNEYFAVIAPIYSFEEKDTVYLEFQYESREEAEDFAFRVDEHRHTIKKHEDIYSIETTGNFYFVNEGDVTILRRIAEILAIYSGR